MNCMVCKDLSRVLESAQFDYKVALAAPFYLVSTEIAAKLQVDMERAKVALREHESSCPPVDLPADLLLLTSPVLSSS